MIQTAQCIAAVLLPAYCAVCSTTQSRHEAYPVLR